MFGFPIWTFGLIAGAISADEAWGRYWGWNPVGPGHHRLGVYAAFLHARATAGWRGRRAHYVQLLGFVSLTVNILVVQVSSPACTHTPESGEQGLSLDQRVRAGRQVQLERRTSAKAGVAAITWPMSSSGQVIGRS